jgi:hypothetical protein
MHQDKKTPAPVIPTDFRAGNMNCTIGFLLAFTITHEGACLRLFEKNAFIGKKLVLVLINNYHGFLPGILIVDQKLILAKGFLYGVDLPHMVAALTALLAFKNHIR